MMCVSTYGVLPTKEAYPSHGIQDFSWDWSRRHGSLPVLQTLVSSPPEQMPWSSLTVNHIVIVDCLALLKAPKEKKGIYQAGHFKGLPPRIWGQGPNLSLDKVNPFLYGGLRAGCPLCGDSMSLDTVGLCMSYLENIVVTAIWPCT